MALKWADDESEHLKQFDLVFHIALRHVKKDDTVEGLILKQHKLAGMGVQAAEIKTIIDGGTGNKVIELHTVSKHPLLEGWQFQYTNFIILLECLHRGNISDVLYTYIPNHQTDHQTSLGIINYLLR